MIRQLSTVREQLVGGRRVRRDLPADDDARLCAAPAALTSAQPTQPADDDARLCAAPAALTSAQPTQPAGGGATSTDVWLPARRRSVADDEQRRPDPRPDRHTTAV